jgi:serine/threonine protein kinase
MIWPPGTKLGPYEIVASLGAGGMGEVHRARDTRLNRDVAIKAIPASLAGDETLRQRFEREARAISSLNHPHICILYDVGHATAQSTTAGGTHVQVDYLVMELLEGESSVT